METLINTVIGYLVAVVSNAVILPLVFGINVSLGQNLLVALLFTFASIIRQYALRRAFNGRSVWQAIKWRNF